MVPKLIPVTIPVTGFTTKLLVETSSKDILPKLLEETSVILIVPPLVLELFQPQVCDTVRLGETVPPLAWILLK